MLTLLYNECIKTFAKWRTYIGFIAVAILIPVVMALMNLEGSRFVERQLRSLSTDFFITGNLFNGWLIAQMIMNGLWVHVPALISLVAGDQLSGEATGGTFRLILIRPVSRMTILNAKYLVTLFYAALLVLSIGALSLGLGLTMFGSGDLVAMDRDMVTILPETQLWLRFLLAYALAIVSMWTVASLAFFISSLVENAIGPIITTMTIIIIFLIISNLPIDAVEPFKPWLFTSYMNVWQLAFKDPIEWSEIARSCSALCAYSFCLWGATVLIFRKKDIVT